LIETRKKNLPLASKDSITGMKPLRKRGKKEKKAEKKHTFFPLWKKEGKNLHVTKKEQ